MIDIYQILDDGRILELKLGRKPDCDHAIWARNLTADEKRIYLQLKRLGYSDSSIYKQLNGEPLT